MYRKPNSEGGYAESHKLKGDHTCNQALVPPVAVGIKDARSEMHTLAQNKAIKELFKTASEIADEVLEETQQQYKGEAVRLLKKEQLQQIVYAAKTKEHETMQARIQSYPLANVADDDERFFFPIHALCCYRRCS